MYFPGYDAVDKKIVAFNMHTGGPMVFLVDCKVRTAEKSEKSVIATEKKKKKKRFVITYCKYMVYMFTTCNSSTYD